MNVIRVVVSLDWQRCSRAAAWRAFPTDARIPSHNLRTEAMGKRYWPNRFHQMVNRRRGLETGLTHAKMAHTRI